MATPAAILQVLLEVESTKATAALRRFDSSVARTGTSSKVATGRTTALNKATSGLGSSLGRAARYAAGAAVAYMSIAQAKAAVTTTQDLAKTTSGLNRNLGLTAKSASRWGTVAKARDIDAKSLTMSFTTLSRRLTDVSKGSDTAIDSFKDIGVTQKDIKQTGGDFNQQLLLIADAFGEAEGGAVRQQAAQKLLGRGYQTLLPMFAEGSKGLEEQMMWADRYGTTLDKKATAAQMRMVNAQRESKVAMLGLQVSFTKAVTPALREANEEFQHLSAIMSNDKLTQTEKFAKVGDVIGKWADKAFDAFTEVLPEIAEAGGRLGVMLIESMAKAFVESDALGRLFLGYTFLKMVGGRGALLKVGATLGAPLGAGMAAGAAATAGGTGAAAGLGARLLGGLKTVAGRAPWIAGGLFIGDTILDGIGDSMDTGGEELQKHLDALSSDTLFEKFGRIGDQNIFKVDAFDAPGFVQSAEQLSDSLADIQASGDKIDGAQVDELRRSLAALPEVSDAARREFNELVGTLEEDPFTKAARDARLAIQDLRFDWTDNMAKMTGITETKLAKIQELMQDKPKKGVEAMNDALRKGVQNIKQAMEDGEIQTRQGLIMIHSLLNKQLQSYGMSHGQAEQIIKAKKTGDATSLQRGGPIETGASSGDSVPALLERGEYVLNRVATAKAGKKNLDALNFGAAPRFQSGGLVQALGPYSIPPIQYDPNHAAPNSHLHISMATVAAAKAIADRIRPMGWTASESPWAGGLTVRHSDPGHYTGQAFDANYFPTETHAAVAAVARILGGAGGAMAGLAGKLKLPRFDALSAAFTPHATGLNQIARGLEKNSDMFMPEVTGGFSGFTGNMAGPLQTIAKRMVNARWDASQWSFFNDLVNRESGWDPTAVNASSGAAGLAQALPPSKYPPGAWPYTGKESAVKQLEWMISYIGGRYGTPAGAIAWHNAHNWYQQGGEVMPSLDRGGRVTQSGLAQVHPGDVHMGKSSPNINVYVDPVSLDVRVETIVEGMAPDIAEFTARQLGRGQGRSRQLSRG